MKATLRNGKGSADHNDRKYINATTEEKEQVIISKQCIKGANSFRDAELKAYELLFGSWLSDMNNKYEKSGHKEDIKTMEQILGGTNASKTKGRYEPEETILQIGKNGDTIPDDVFYACIQDFLKKLQAEYGQNMQILNYAIHKENSSVLHCHIRRVWYAIDENGHKKPAKKEALKQLGYIMPDGVKADRYNNLTVYQTIDERQLWYDILAEHGLQIDEIPDLDNAEHHTTREHKRIMQANERQIKAQEKTIQQNKARIAETERQMENLHIAHEKDSGISLDDMLKNLGVR